MALGQQARLDRILREVTTELALIIQHGPDGPYVRLRDHPATRHIEIIERQMKWVRKSPKWQR